MKTLDPAKIKDFYKYSIQPKLNGLFAEWDSAQQKLISKSGHEIKSVPHIVKLFAGEMNNVEGEIYSHEMSFQRINRTVMHGLDSSEILEFYTHKHIQSYDPKTKDEFNKLYADFLDYGYEGVVFTDKVTGEQFKHKPRQDMEAVIVGFNKGTGKNVDTFGAIVLETEHGERFKCSNMTTRDRNRLWADQAIGETVKVSYLFLTERGVPVSPAFVDYRWDVVIKPKSGGARKGSGRKPMNPSEKRSVRKMQRWTESETNLIEIAAKKAGLKEADFIRMAVMGLANGE